MIKEIKGRGEVTCNVKKERKQKKEKEERRGDQ